MSDSFQQFPPYTGTLSPEHRAEMEERQRILAAEWEERERIADEVRADVLARPIGEVRSAILTLAKNASSGHELSAVAEVLNQIDSVVAHAVAMDERLRPDDAAPRPGRMMGMGVAGQLLGGLSQHRGKT